MSRFFRPWQILAMAGRHLRAARQRGRRALAQGMNRIRHAYVEASPAIERYLVTGRYDDERGLYRTYAADPPAGQQLHALFTTPGMVSVINAVVGASIAGIASQALGLPTVPAAALAVAAFVAAFIAHWQFQARVLAKGSGLPSEFPDADASPGRTKGHHHQ